MRYFTIILAVVLFGGCSSSSKKLTPDEIQINQLKTIVNSINADGYIDRTEIFPHLDDYFEAERQHMEYSAEHTKVLVFEDMTYYYDQEHFFHRLYYFDYIDGKWHLVGMKFEDGENPPDPEWQAKLDEQCNDCKGQLLGENVEVPDFNYFVRMARRYCEVSLED